MVLKSWQRSSFAQTFRDFREADIERCEWQTSGDERVCEHCAELDGKILSVQYLFDEWLRKKDGLFYKCKSKNDGCRCVLLAKIPEIEDKTPTIGETKKTIPLWVKIAIVLVVLFFIGRYCV